MPAPAPPADESAPRDPHRLCQYLLELSPQPTVAVEGPDHVVAYANPAFARLVGAAPGDLVGRPFADAVPPDAAGGCLALMDRVLGTGVAEGLAEQERRGDPPAFWSYAAWATFGAPGEPAGVLVQVADATPAALFRRQAVAVNEALVLSSVRQHELIEALEAGERARRDLESQLLKAQKLESLGVLAGGIAHDLNNILTPVLGFAELARDSLPGDSAAAPMLDEVAANARRAADLVERMLAYAGQGQSFAQRLDLTLLVRQMGALLGAACSPRAAVSYDLARGLPAVEADATQLRQVVQNLVTNAAEATEGGGGVAVRTLLTPVAADAVWSAHRKSYLPAGPYVTLEVTDSGCGMDPATVEKVFDPFFTTKFAGLGLGLAAVQGIAHAHHGVVEVASEPGRGSTFRLLLPAAAGPAAPPPAPRRGDDWRGTGEVLLIDHDRAVRDLTTRVLERAGFTVFAADDGAAGLEMVRECPGEVAAAVVNLTSPGVDGLGAVAALRDLRPGLPTVLTGSFTLDDLPPDVAACVTFVSKPFTTAELVAAVRHALGQ